METTPSYFLVINDEQAGPFTEEEVRAKLAAGEVTEETLVWKEGMADWAALSTLDFDKPKLKLRAAESPQPVVAPPAAAQPKPALASPAHTSRPVAAGVQASRTCSACKQSITDVYYQVDGSVMCANCRTEAEAVLKGGSAMKGFLRASGVGLVAAIISGLIWYAVIKLTDREFGLLAIGVGLLVGFAVRWGSYNRGGWAYQILAVLLTYLAIASSTIPFIIEGMRENAREEAALIDTNAVRAALAALATNDTGNSELTITAGSNAVASATTPTAAAQGTDNEPIPAIVTWVFAIGFAFIAPFFGGIMGIVILGIALYEAWKINTRAKVEITGPHPVSGPVRGSASA